MSVAVHIGHAGIVGRIGVFTRITPSPGASPWSWLRLHCRYFSTFGFLKRNRQVANRGILVEREVPVCASALHFIDGILRKWVLVNEERAVLGEGLLVQFLAVAIDIEGLVSLVIMQNTPRNKDFAVRLTYCHDTAVGFLRDEA